MFAAKKTDSDSKLKKKPTATPNQIFFGILLGTVAGLIPFIEPLNFIILFLFLIFRFNLIAGLIFFVSAKFISFQYLTDFINKTGFYILTSDATIDFSKWFVSLPVIPYLNFTNTFVMGGAAWGISAGLIIGLVVRAADKKIREARSRREIKEELPPQTRQPRIKPQPGNNN